MERIDRKQLIDFYGYLEKNGCLIEDAKGNHMYRMVDNFIEGNIQLPKGPGRLVKTKTELDGYVSNSDKLINGKIPVYTNKGKFLCKLDELKFVGFYD